MALDENTETFIVYIAALLAVAMQVHPFHQTQLELLLAEKVPIKVLPEYLNYGDVFLLNFNIKLLKNVDINKYAIKLVEGKQPSDELIYDLVYKSRSTS